MENEKNLKIDKLAELYARVEADFTLNEGNVMEKSLRAPILYNKWMMEFTKRSLELKQKMVNLEKIAGRKTKYFKEEYNRDLKVGEIEKYLFTDDEYVNIYRQTRELEVICAYLEGITKKMSNLGFDVKNYIELKKFLNGSN